MNDLNHLTQLLQSSLDPWFRSLPINFSASIKLIDLKHAENEMFTHFWQHSNRFLYKNYRVKNLWNFYSKNEDEKVLRKIFSAPWTQSIVNWSDKWKMHTQLVCFYSQFITHWAKKSNNINGALKLARDMHGYESIHIKQLSVRLDWNIKKWDNWNGSVHS